MNINEKIISDSEDEDNSVINNKLTNCKKKTTITETFVRSSSSNENTVTENLNSAKQYKEKYMQQVNKIKRNTGQGYYTKKGKFIEAKKFQSINCNCSKECMKRVNETERKAIFHKFWNMGDFNKQNVFLKSNVQRKTVNRRRPRNNLGIIRAYTYKFYLMISDENILVCKKFFIDTFQISSGRINRILKVYENIPQDMRGKMDGSSRKTSELMINTVREHLRSLNWDQNQNYQTMYNLYLKKCKEKNLNPVKIWTYRKIAQERLY
ncbi:PREDICTED: uncharacterized protein LOC107067368 [Polistes dominula]|uniref:Uncharacterized protein LOC107067368 n=1 Tax=Polistes dominula TaxID=743375 RepID=A0ABM1IDL6_POLDO|nr:PREDICTED: uncharacterized protein LOC107067368 [Polistes dominula]